MSYEFAYRYRQDAPASGLRELDRVALTAAVTSDDGDAMPSGAEGTIVGVYNDGEAYAVEFAVPAGALANVEVQHLRLVERAGL